MRVEFKHKAVRDLAWVIGSPLLLQMGGTNAGTPQVDDHLCRLVFWDRIPWLRVLDEKPDELEQWLAAYKSGRLGHYYEGLVEFCLLHWRRVELRAARVPVREAGRSLGEFDFLFFDKRLQCAVHWEVAAKFYLGLPQADGEYAWLGPNPEDTLSAKMSHLRSHQLRLGEAPAAQPLLEGLGLSAPLPEAMVKGYLFYPSTGDWQQPAAVPAGVSPQHAHGWWTRASARHLPGPGDSRWLPLSRLQWLSPVRAEGEAPGMGRAELDSWLDGHFAGEGGPVLLAELAAERSGHWRERSRGFIVPTHWPAQG